MAKLIYTPSSTVKGDRLIVHGAGKFQEERLTLSKDRAALLYIELYEFLGLGKTKTKTNE